MDGGGGWGLQTNPSFAGGMTAICPRFLQFFLQFFFPGWGGYLVLHLLEAGLAGRQLLLRLSQPLLFGPHFTPDVVVLPRRGRWVWDGQETEPRENVNATPSH